MRLSRIPAATKTAPPAPPTRGPRGPREGGLVNVVVGRSLPERAAGALHQISLDEDIEVAVEHAVDIAHLLLRAVILHELIRVQHVAADLRPEGDVALGAAELIEP